MNFTEIIKHINGFSCPIFGVQWSPTELEIAKARRVIAFLEDRRVLYNPSEMEMPDHCVDSVIEIRHFLTGEIGGLHKDDALSKSLRAMRAACRKFLDAVQNGKSRVVVRRQDGSYSSWIFNAALGELRGVFGIHVGMLAAQYGLDVEDPLAAILPEVDREKS